MRSARFTNAWEIVWASKNQGIWRLLFAFHILANCDYFEILLFCYYLIACARKSARSKNQNKNIFKWYLQRYSQLIKEISVFARAIFLWGLNSTRNQLFDKFYMIYNELASFQSCRTSQIVDFELNLSPI